MLLANAKSESFPCIFIQTFSYSLRHMSSCHKEKQTTIHSHTDLRKNVPNAPHMHNFGLRDIAIEPRKNSHRRRENRQTQHRP